MWKKCKKIWVSKGIWSLLYNQYQIFLKHAVFATFWTILNKLRIQNFRKNWWSKAKMLAKNCNNALPPDGVSPTCNSLIFFQIFDSVTCVPLWCPNFMQRNRKTNKQVSEIFQVVLMDHRLTDMGDYIGPLRISQGPKWQFLFYSPKVLKGFFHFLHDCRGQWDASLEKQ